MSTPTSPPRVLITGAAGRVAGVILPGLTAYRLRLLDRVRPSAVPEGAEPQLGDVTDRAVIRAACQDVDTVVHLAANPQAPASWDDLVGPNIEGLEQVLSAALGAGVRRVVLASSVHAAGASVLATDQGPVDPDRPPYPCCRYGATKAFAEALGRTYSYRGGLSVLCLRFGGVSDHPGSRGGVTAWIGPQDTRQLVVKAVEAPASLAYGVYHGISRPGRHEWNLDNAGRDLGYLPECEEPADLDPNEQRWLCGSEPLGMPADF